ncbi:MAG: FAD-dependent thymidylate synthase [Pleurocapsa minor GSE-CHR-MK-17-07R]|jgi:thymidylate synthase (FAD)|nr:FAD-dependent thymidylate synthase [Pleurocapsa minor GSE-CHR-MK 17-07R]
MANLIGHRVNVLDKGWVELVDLMPHPASEISGDLAIVNAARVSFLGESKGPEADKKLLFYLLRNAHTSPFEMVEFKFRVHAPLVTWWQWVRHRTFHFQTVNAQSGRYTPFEEDDFYVPNMWRKQAKSNKQASDGELEEASNEAFLEQLTAHYDASFTLYKNALEAGISKEMARLFLPGFAVYYTWVVKVDALNLMNFLRLRLAQDAQYEIRVYAEAMYNDFFKPLLPWTSEAFEQYVLNAEA